MPVAPRSGMQVHTLGGIPSKPRIFLTPPINYYSPSILYVALLFAAGSWPESVGKLIDLFNEGKGQNCSILLDLVLFHNPHFLLHF